MAEPKSQVTTTAGAFVPKAKILERLLLLVQENYWVYGVPSADAPNRLERWDLRSMLDFAVVTCQTWSLSYGTFLHQRNTVMGLLMEMAEVENYGEWRFWETEARRTHMDIERIVSRTLEAERKR